MITKLTQFITERSNVAMANIFDTFFNKFIAYLEKNADEPMDYIFMEAEDLSSTGYCLRVKNFLNDSKLFWDKESAIMVLSPLSDVDVDTFLSFICKNLNLGLNFTDYDKRQGSFNDAIGDLIILTHNLEDGKTEKNLKVRDTIEIFKKYKYKLAHEFTHLIDAKRKYAKSLLTRIDYHDKHGKFLKPKPSGNMMGYHLKDYTIPDYYNFTHEIHAYVQMVLQQIEDEQLQFDNFTDLKDTFIKYANVSFIKNMREDTQKNVNKLLYQYFTG